MDLHSGPSASLLIPPPGRGRIGWRELRSSLLAGEKWGLSSVGAGRHGGGGIEEKPLTLTLFPEGEGMRRGAPDLRKPPEVSAGLQRLTLRSASLRRAL